MKLVLWWLKKCTGCDVKIGFNTHFHRLESGKESDINSSGGFSGEKAVSLCKSNSRFGHRSTSNGVSRGGGDGNNGEAPDIEIGISW